MDVMTDKFDQAIDKQIQEMLDLFYKPANYLDDIVLIYDMAQEIQVLAIHKQYKFLYHFLSLYVDIITYMKDNNDEFSPYDIHFLTNFTQDIQTVFVKEYTQTIEQSNYQILFNEHLIQIQNYLDSDDLSNHDQKIYIHSKYNLSLPNYALSYFLSKASRYKMAMHEIFSYIDNHSYDDNLAISKAKETASDFIQQFNNLFQDRKNLSLKQLYKFLQTLISSLNKQHKKRVEFNFIGQGIALDKSIILHIKNILVELIYNVFKHGLDNSIDYAIACITIRTQITGGYFFIHCCDDTPGIDLDRLLSPNERHIHTLSDHTLSDNDKLDHILYEVYKDEVKHFLGLKRIKLDSQLLDGAMHYNKLNDGEEFIISLPINFQAQVFEFYINDTKYGIPNFYIDKIHSFNDMVLQAHQAITTNPYFDQVAIYKEDNEPQPIPFIHLERLFNIPHTEEDIDYTEGLMVVLQSNNSKIAFALEEISSYNNAYIRSITKNLASVKTKPQIPFILGAYQIEGESLLRLALDAEDIINKSTIYLRS